MVFHCSGSGETTDLVVDLVWGDMGLFPERDGYM